MGGGTELGEETIVLRTGWRPTRSKHAGEGSKLAATPTEVNLNS